MTYKQVHHIRRTPAEIKSFNMAYHAFLEQGYPAEIARQYCWDILHNARRARKVSFL